MELDSMLENLTNIIHTHSHKSLVRFAKKADNFIEFQFSFFPHHAVLACQTMVKQLLEHPEEGTSDIGAPIIENIQHL